MRELNQCVNAANDLLRSENPVVAELVVAIIRRAFALGSESAKGSLVSAMEKISDKAL